MPGEHRERPRPLDHPPRQVDEAATGRTLYVRTPHVAAGDYALEVPHRFGRVAGCEAEKFAGLGASLDGDVNAVMALGSVGGGAAAGARQVVALDAQDNRVSGGAHARIMPLVLANSRRYARVGCAGSWTGVRRAQTGVGISPATKA